MYSSLLRTYHTCIEIPYYLETCVLQKQKALLFVVRITNRLRGTDVIGLEPLTQRFLLRLLMYSLP
jgi:hypothetical protein